MCEQLGSEPIEDEIPVELSDLPDEAQEAWIIYCHLPDKIDSFNGHYLGKALENISSLFELFDIQSRLTRLTILTIVNIFDRQETEEINSKNSKKKK